MILANLLKFEYMKICLIFLQSGLNIYIFCKIFLISIDYPHIYNDYLKSDLNTSNFKRLFNTVSIDFENQPT